MKKTVIITTVLLLTGCLPKAPNYPYKNLSKVDKDIDSISSKLESHIKNWFGGKASAEIPTNLLPVGYEPKYWKDFKLIKYENIDPKRQWAIREAHTINFQKLKHGYPDPHCTYLVVPAILVPFGSKIIVEGEYPYSRFFNIQVTAPFDANEYRYDKVIGKGEVAIVDVDIKPEPGSINPFLVGSDRLAKNRKYKVVYEMAKGNPTALNPGHKPPYYRGEGNKRYGSALQFQGPWGENKKDGHGRGLYDIGDIWIRYYGIDHNKGVLGGVLLPKVYYELPSGEKFYIECNFEDWITPVNSTIPIRNIGNDAKPQTYQNGTIGWSKQYGIFLNTISGLASVLGKESPEDKAYIRKLDLGVTGRGENQPPPANYEPHATGCNYINYLTRTLSLDDGKVAIITGKLPTFPDTRSGSKAMGKADCRYWSITSYDTQFPFAKQVGIALTSVMDDEITIDKDRYYILVYSREKDKPKNATTQNGVTWLNWGSVGTHAWTIRWMTVGPEWSFAKSPTEDKLPWAKTMWSGSQYDPTILATNNQKGFLGEYQPIVHYLTKAEFEALGNSLNPNTIPIWTKAK
jgi:hypothetical protein